MSLVLGVVSLARERGKTSLVEHLTKQFHEEGFKVVTVKHIHHVFDTAKKDTWRHLDAGAAMTIASTPTEIVTIKRSVQPSLEEALEVIGGKADLVLVEGYKETSTPKILCADTFGEVQTAMSTVSNIVMISGLITSKRREMERIRLQFPDVRTYQLDGLVSAIREMLEKAIQKGLPNLNCGRCGYTTCLDLAKMISRGEAMREDCDVLATNPVTLIVDGRTVPIGKFPQEAVRGVVLGLVGSLKGVGENPRNIEIMVRAS